MNQRNLHNYRFLAAALLFFTVSVTFNVKNAEAQLQEPPVKEIEAPISPYGQGYRNRLGVSFVLNNFGFGITGIYARTIGPFTEVTLTAGITGIKNVSSQEFVYFRARRKVVPNRYKRALGFPVMLGIERRLFPYAIDDNFRFFISADFGPAFAFTYPYFKDVNGNGYRDTFKRCLTIQGQVACRLRFAPVEDINSFFSGFGKGSWHFGMSGDLSIGVDIGRDFEGQATLEIGYFFYYFPGGLQLMEPFKNTGYVVCERCESRPNVEIRLDTGQQPFFDEKNYFGTPQLKFTYSWWL